LSMQKFLDKYSSYIHGVIHGFDRIILKGHIGDFYYKNGFYYFLSQETVKLKDFKSYALKITDQLKSHVEKTVSETGAYTEYLNSSKASKEDIAKRVAKAEGITEGLICVLSAVEPCNGLSVGYNKATGLLERKTGFRKCLHYYFYYMDRDFGLMYVRFQTWFPFGIQIYINGREYLKKQLDKADIKYRSYENSIGWVEDIEKAQAISDKFQEKKWHKVFDQFAERVNGFLPRIKEIFSGQAYKWYIEQCEYATDIMFKDRQGLRRLYPYLVEYASLCQVGENIFTFFGRKVHWNCQGEAVSDRKHYAGQGFRVKFTLDKNSVKVYDKSNNLRIETTINNASAFKVYNSNNKRKWGIMGKAISNLYRYGEVSKSCNMRYIDSLSNVDSNENIDREIEKLCNSKEVKLSSRCEKPRRFSGFNLLSDFTTKIFNAVLSGEYTIRGFRNKDLREKLLKLGLFSGQDILNVKRLSGKITRLLAKLRAHKIITKLNKTCRYRVSKSGEKILSRILMFKKFEMKTC
jgi:hypothetical protein